jgi:hypothetical protein
LSVHELPFAVRIYQFSTIESNPVPKPERKGPFLLRGIPYRCESLADGLCGFVSSTTSIRLSAAAKKKAWNALQAFSQVAIAGSRQISLHGSVWVKGAIRHVGAEPTLLSE